MGRQIIKVAKDRDLYMEWSSIVEAPTLIGTRAEFAKHLTAPKQGQQVEVRLARADATGSSGWAPFGCSWDDDGEVYMQQGVLPRSRMADFADRWLALPDDGTLPDVADLLLPFED